MTVGRGRPRAGVRAAACALAVAVTLAACTDDGDSPGEDATTEDAAGEDGTGGDADAAPPAGPVAAPVRHPAVDAPIYFVMTDRFANGDPSNDTGGLPGGPLDHGFLPEDIGFHQGGDIAGLTERLDYIAGLGVGAIWVTPPFTNDPVQGDGTIAGSSSGYHGYWQVDFSAIDPHLGTDEEFRAFVDAAHDRGLRVYVDAVLNHTGDVIVLDDGGAVPYVNTGSQPYLDADGSEIDLAALEDVDAADWPTLDPVTSFPYVPTLLPGDEQRKSPDWLNDVTLYHNRGNSTFSGESSLLGDFFGLDDLMTEHPRVREGMTEVYAGVVERFGIDGFRVDTVKHVEVGFWEHWAPGVRERSGVDDLFMFGEVFDTSPILGATFTRAGLSSTLDFGLDSALTRYALEGNDADQLAQVLDDDDWFTDPDGSVAMQVTFLGNHDEGRLGTALRNANPGADEDVLLARAKLAQDLLFTLRGIPVVYYGDEQGFVGDGRDQLARAPMFPAVAEEYLDDDSIGTDATPADDNFDTSHPLYEHVAAAASRRAALPGLRTGASRVLLADGPLFAFSRTDRDERTEYIVVANTGQDAATATVEVLTAGATFTAVDDDTTTATADPDGTLSIDVPPLSLVVLRPDTTVPVPEEAPTVALERPADGDVIGTEVYRFEAVVGDDRYAEVTFALSVDGGDPVVLGTDDAPPYRVYWDATTVDRGTSVEVVATVVDLGGHTATARGSATVDVPER
jgi:alpha-amylase